MALRGRALNKKRLKARLLKTKKAPERKRRCFFCNIKIGIETLFTLASLMTSTGQKFSMLVLAHFLAPFFNHATQQTTSVHRDIYAIRITFNVFSATTGEIADETTDEINDLGSVRRRQTLPQCLILGR